MLKKISDELENSNASDYFKKNQHPSNFESVNHKLLNNKDGSFSWRPFQLIHPVLYVDLVNKITKKDNWQKIKQRINNIRSKSKIESESLPVKSDSNQSDKAEQINEWWEEV
jgi:hypothetical protein